MRRHLLTISLFALALSVSARPSAAGGPTHVLRFLNGDVLHGRLAGIGSDGLDWHRPDAAGDLRFALDQIERIEVDDAVPVWPAADPLLCQVTLTNGDVLFGRVLSLDGEQLRLQTGYAGELDVRTVMVASLLTGVRPPESIIAAAENLDAWRAVGPWRVSRGWLTGLGTLGLNAELPDRARISFTASWLGLGPSFSVCLYTDDISSRAGQCYVLVVRGNGVQLLRRMGNRGSQPVGSADLGGWDDRNSARFEILVSRDQRLLALRIDDNLVDFWVDGHSFGGGGGGLVLATGDQAVRMSYRNVQVQTWDGRTALTELQPLLAEDQLLYGDDRRAIGKLLSADADSLHFETPGERLEIPWRRAKFVALASETRARARRYAEDVRLLLGQAGAMTVRLGSVSGDSISGYTENCGEVCCARQAVEAFQLNLYRQPHGHRQEP